MALPGGPRAHPTCACDGEHSRDTGAKGGAWGAARGAVWGEVQVCASVRMVKMAPNDPLSTPSRRCTHAGVRFFRQDERGRPRPSTRGTAAVVELPGGPPGAAGGAKTAKNSQLWSAIARRRAHMLLFAAGREGQVVGASGSRRAGGRAPPGATSVPRPPANGGRWGSRERAPRLCADACNAASWCAGKLCVSPSSHTRKLSRDE